METQARLAGGPVEHVLRASVQDGAAAPVSIPVVSSSVTMDEGWTPHVQVSIQTGPEAYTLADPRTGGRLLLEAGYVTPAGTEDVHDLANVGLRSVQLQRPDDTTTIEAASDEAIVSDARVWLGSAPSPGGVNEHVASVLALTIPGATLTSVLPAGTLAADVAELAYTFGDSLWKNLPTLVAAAGAHLWCGPDRVWHITAPASVDARSQATLTTGPGGVVTRSESVTSREDSEGWVNWLAVRAAGSTAFAWVLDGPYGITEAGMRGDLLDLGADAYAHLPTLEALAARVLGRRFTKGRQVSLSAPAMYWLRPGHTVTFRLPDGQPQRGIVSRITFTHPAGLMQLTLRLPETGTIQAGE